MTSVAPIYQPQETTADRWNDVFARASTPQRTSPPPATMEAASEKPSAGATQPPEVAERQADPANGAPPAPVPASSPESQSQPAQAARTLNLRSRKRKKVPLRLVLPAWSVSLLVHVVILTTLAAATFTSQDAIKKVIRFDTALAGYRSGEREMLNVWADPAAIPRDRATGNEHGGKTAPPAEMLGESDGDDSGSGMVVSAAFGSGAPTMTPRFRGTGKRGVNERNSLPDKISIAGLQQSPLSTLPSAPAADLYGGGMIAGDPIFDVKNIGEALDQLALEILRHLKDHRVTVVWLFDESNSMKDDQQSILEKFDRVSSELKKNIDRGQKSSGALNHVIVGFGEGLDFVTKKPTLDLDEITRAIKILRTDLSGTEKTMQAITKSVQAYAGLINKDRKMLLVLVTDESGDDGADVEEARQTLTKHNVPLYVLGRQSLFGYEYAHYVYKDPGTQDVYYPLIRRGPETADVEIYQWDGLYDRWDEQPSGFAPWELARLTRASGGIYFLLPSEEQLRIRQREKAYSFAQLKEYQPEYDNRLTYVKNRTSHDLRRLLFEIITETKSFVYRRNYPIDSAELIQAAAPEIQKATEKLNTLLAIQKRLEDMKQYRDREPQKRWQAHYDLMLAQTVAFQVKAYEYRALMNQIVKKPPIPKQQSTPNLTVTFVVDHAQEPQAAQSETAKKYAEAKRMLQEVITKHPNTPWADLAQDMINRGFSVRLNEWHHSPKYAERAQYVPKY